MAFCWPDIESRLGIGSFVIFQGIRTSIAKEPYSFVIFQGWGSGLPVPPLDLIMDNTLNIYRKEYEKESEYD